MAELDNGQFDDELLSAYLDDELSAEERARVEQQVAADPKSRQLLDELRSVSQAMQDLPQASLGGDLRESVLRRAERAMLVAEDGSGAELSHWMRFGRSKRAWFWAGAALAAGLMLMFIERTKNQDAGLPNQVALKRPAATAPSEPRTPPAMRALESSGETFADAASSTPQLADSMESIPSESKSSLPESGAERDRVAVDRFARSGPSGGMGGLATDDMEAGVPVSGMASRDGAVVEEAIDEPLVVRVRLTPEAMENRAFDATLLNNSIVVDPELTESVPISNEKSRLRSEEQVDVVIVEAEPKQVRSTLAEINVDKKNYLAIVVEPQADRRQSNSGQREFVADAQQYNRGSISSPKLVRFAPDYLSFYYQSDEDRSAGRRSMTNGEQPLAINRYTTRELSSPADETTARSHAVPKDDWHRNTQLEQLSRRAVQKLEARNAPNDMMQVMFVLQSQEIAEAPPAQSPATASPAQEGLNANE